MSHYHQATGANLEDPPLGKRVLGSNGESSILERGHQGRNSVGSFREGRKLWDEVCSRAAHRLQGTQGSWATVLEKGTRGLCCMEAVEGRGDVGDYGDAWRRLESTWRAGHRVGCS